ncbi:hypothetical protein MLD52_18890 [Puniceicoccaceae bacterium K14]|nr:hypothetical protein [Puniceicoccaceae bacterium K14]
MIIGQLIQAGKKFCEYRSQDFLPTTDTQHTFLAYNVFDSLDTQVFNENSLEDAKRVSKWLKDHDSIAYIIISRQFNNTQREFPAPLGVSLQKTITITAAISDTLAQMNFEVRGETGEMPLKLISISESRRRLGFISRNYFNDLTTRIQKNTDSNQFTFRNLSAKPVKLR